MSKPCIIAVGIPTVGRATVLRETLRELGRQTRRADVVFVCGTSTADLDFAAAAYPGVQLLLPSQPGLTRQRNAIIAATKDADILIFFDDDFLPDPDYLAAIERAMIETPGIVVATGHVLADGIIGPGLTPAEGRLVLHGALPAADAITPVFTGYGCNMAIRLQPVRHHVITFDSRLPLYGWQEDVDLSRRLSPFGAIVRVASARGVHLGVKSGRASGIRLGYSQVANPIYLSRKRLGYPFRWALTHIARNMAMNVSRSLRPEPYVDRRGRLLGNFIAIYDLLRGKMTPERVLDL